MATVAEIDRIEALKKRLFALGKARRGDLILAQQWNDLVDVVTVLADEILASGVGDHVPPHEHPDQVKVSWLSPTLRSLFEKGPLADPGAVNRVNEVEGRVRAVTGDLDKLRETLNVARDRVTELSTRDLVRESEASEVRLMVGSLSERRDDVLELRKTLGSISEKVDKAVEASSKLVIGGQPVDMNVLDKRIADVEAFREGFRGPGRVLLDAVQFETRLATLQNKLVTQEQLEKALKDRPTELDASQLAAIRDDISVTLREETQSTLNTLSTEIRAETAAQLADVDTRIVQRIDERVPAAVGVEIDKVRGENKSANDATLASAQEAIDRAVAALSDSVLGTLTAQIAAVRGEVQGRITTELATQLPAAIAPLQAAVNAARAEATTIAARLGELSTTLTQARARIEEVSRDSTKAVKDARDALTAEMATRAAAQARTLDQRFAELDERLTPLFGLDTRLTSLSNTIDTRATEAAQSAVKLPLAQVRTDMEGIARTQALALQDTIRDTVLRSVESSLPERIRGEMRTAFQRELMSDTTRTFLTALIRSTR